MRKVKVEGKTTTHTIAMYSSTFIRVISIVTVVLR